MHLQKYFVALLAGAMIAPAAMAKTSSPLHVKKVPAKLRAAGKAKKDVSETPATKGKRSRKSSEM